jgi:hypothetical protein
MHKAEFIISFLFPVDTLMFQFSGSLIRQMIYRYVHSPVVLNNWSTVQYVC